MNYELLYQLIDHHLQQNDLCEFLLARFVADQIEWNSLSNHMKKTIENLHMECTSRSYKTRNYSTNYFIDVIRYTLFSKYHTNVMPVSYTIVPKDNEKSKILIINLWFKNNLLHRDHDQPAIVILSTQYTEELRLIFLKNLVFDTFPFPKSLSIENLGKLKKGWCINGEFIERQGTEWYGKPVLKKNKI